VKEYEIHIVSLFFIFFSLHACVHKCVNTFFVVENNRKKEKKRKERQRAYCLLQEGIERKKKEKNAYNSQYSDMLAKSNSSFK
jgi:uncharacterized protein YlxW (UPF0749 family)